MEVIRPGQHGSTFGGNPLAVSIAKKALEVVPMKKLAQNARRLGAIFRAEMNIYIEKSKIVKLVRGKGLLNAIVINDTPEKRYRLEHLFKAQGQWSLAKPTHGNIIRFAPPLVMSEEQLYDCIKIITGTLKTFEPNR